MTEMSRHANGDSIPYWEGARQGRLLFQKCKGCGSVQFPPRHHCAACWEDDLDWTESSGKAVVESFTIVHRAPLPEFRDRVPYVVASVIVEEGPRMLTNIVGDGALQVQVGARVQATFVTGEDGETLPQFTLA